MVDTAPPMRTDTHSNDFEAVDAIIFWLIPRVWARACRVSKKVQVVKVGAELTKVRLGGSEGAPK
jgi:hypothetical protein